MDNQKYFRFSDLPKDLQQPIGFFYKALKALIILFVLLIFGSAIVYPKLVLPVLLAFLGCFVLLEAIAFHQTKTVILVGIKNFFLPPEERKVAEEWRFFFVRYNKPWFGFSFGLMTLFWLIIAFASLLAAAYVIFI